MGDYLGTVWYFSGHFIEDTVLDDVERMPEYRELDTGKICKVSERIDDYRIRHGKWPASLVDDGCLTILREDAWWIAQMDKAAVKATKGTYAKWPYLGGPMPVEIDPPEIRRCVGEWFIDDTVLETADRRPEYMDKNTGSVRDLSASVRAHHSRYNRWPAIVTGRNGLSHYHVREDLWWSAQCNRAHEQATKRGYSKLPKAEDFNPASKMLTPILR